jgi:hypothetical protein
MNNRNTTYKAKIGGVMSITSASFTILFVFVVFAVEYIRYSMGEIAMPPGSTYFLAFGGLRLIWLAASVLAIVGGVLAIKRKNWLLALTGTAASIICLPMILGVAATILVALSKKEFKTWSPVFTKADCPLPHYSNKM